MTLILIENAGFSPAFIYEAEGFVLKRFGCYEFDFPYLTNDTFDL